MSWSTPLASRQSSGLYEKYACASKVLNPTFPRQEALEISVLTSVHVVEVKLAARGPVLLTLSHWPLAKVKVLDYNCKFTLSSLVDRYYTKQVGFKTLEAGLLLIRPELCWEA